MINEQAAAATSSPRPRGPAGTGTVPVRLAPNTQLSASTGIGVAGHGDIVDEWGMQSFPASDPPANW